jgi:tryptophanyl-tRNA synthetase
MSAKTGGGITLEEHKKNGGEPEKCSIYELFMYHLVEDDSYLKELYDTCKAGTRSCGQCKKEAAEMLSQFLKNLEEKRDVIDDNLDEYISWE